MYRTILFSVLLLFAGCRFLDKNTCSDNPDTKHGRSLNSERLKMGVPVIHDYMCYESETGKTQNWRAAVSFQKTAKNGFHAGKGIFIDSDAELDEKDIFRHRINDSTFESLGILSEVYNGDIVFPSIWYTTVDERYLFGERKSGFETDPSTHRSHLTIEQADSILTSWGTGRK